MQKSSVTQKVACGDVTSSDIGTASSHFCPKEICPKIHTVAMLFLSLKTPFYTATVCKSELFQGVGRDSDPDTSALSSNLLSASEMNARHYY